MTQTLHIFENSYHKSPLYFPKLNNISLYNIVSKTINTLVLAFWISHGFIIILLKYIDLN